MAKTTTKKGSNATKTARKDTKPTTAQQTAPALDPATMPDDELKANVSALFDEFKRRAYAAEGAKRERIAALRAELADLGGGTVVLASDPQPDEEAPAPDRDPEPALKDIAGIHLQSQDKLFIRQALVAAACLVERGIIALSEPGLYVDGIQDMCVVAQVISRAMWAAHNSTGDLIWMADELAAPDPVPAPADED